MAILMSIHSSHFTIGEQNHHNNNTEACELWVWLIYSIEKFNWETINIGGFYEKFDPNFIFQIAFLIFL